MHKRKINPQLVYLFLSSFTVLFVGMGLFPLLPVYAAEFGASPTSVGIYYALIYGSNAGGHMLTGWLAGRVSRRGLFIAAGTLGIVSLALMGQARSLGLLVLLTSLVWFTGGVLLSLVNIFTGLISSSKSRGKSFSLMSLAMPLGALLGGLLVGNLVAWQGYGVMFAVLAGIWLVLPVVGLFGLHDQPGMRPAQTAARGDGKLLRACQTFFWLMGISILAAVAISSSRLGTSLSMRTLEFSATQIASSATISGLVTIPVILLFGVLSDRIGRSRILALSFLAATGGAAILIAATQLWQFWLAATLLMVASSAQSAMTSALATDVLAPQALNRGLAWLNTAGSAGGILSFAATGVVIDMFGPQYLYLATALLPAFAIFLLQWTVRKGQPSLNSGSAKESIFCFLGVYRIS